MPPLPSTLDAQTLSIIDILGRRLRDLVEVQIPRLRDCTGPLSLQQQLAGELREDTDTCAQQIESLDVAVDDQQNELSRRELRKAVDQFQKDLARVKKDARAALLASKRAIDAQSASNRDELLRSSALNEKQAPMTSADDALMKANNDVTATLQRTMGLMQAELEKSVLSSQLLEESTATLSAASSQHDTLSLVMSASKQLITILEKSDWLDRMLLIAGLGFFFLVVLFILKQRIVDRGLRIAFWWTRFLPDSKGAALNDAERGVLSSGIAETVASLTTGAAAAMSTATALLSSNAQPPTSHTTPTVVPPLVETAVYMDATVSWLAGTMDVVSSTSSVEMATSSDTVDSIHDEL